MAKGPQNSSGQAGGAARATLIALAACAAVTLIALPVASALDHANIVMVYLLATALVAMRFGRTAGVVAACASVLLFDFFFVAPRFSFAVEDAQYLITFVVMLVVALLIAALTARLRGEAETAVAREARARALYQLAHEISGAFDVARIQSLVAAFLKAEFGVEAELLLPGPDGELGSIAEGSRQPPADLAVARRVLDDRGADAVLRVGSRRDGPRPAAQCADSPARGPGRALAGARLGGRGKPASAARCRGGTGVDRDRAGALRRSRGPGAGRDRVGAAAHVGAVRRIARPAHAADGRRRARRHAGPRRIRRCRRR